MLHIAICDDETNQRLQTRQLLEEYLSARGIVARVWEFTAGRALLNAVQEHGAADIYLLDIIMPEMDGIALGTALRRSDRDGAIIYLTTSADFALESYQVRAFYYLLKPVERKPLYAVLDEAVRIWQRRRENGIQVKTRDGLVRIPLDNLLYAELKNRAVRYYLRDGGSVDSVTSSGAFRETVSPLLTDARFQLCGASFVVNLHYIKMVSKSGVILTDGRALELPKAACATLRTAWSSYWLEGGNVDA